MSKLISIPASVVSQVDGALGRLSFESQCGLGQAAPELRDAVAFCIQALGALRAAVAVASEGGGQTAAGVCCCGAADCELGPVVQAVPA